MKNRMIIVKDGGFIRSFDGFKSVDYVKLIEANYQQKTLKNY